MVNENDDLWGCQQGESLCSIGFSKATARGSEGGGGGELLLGWQGRQAMGAPSLPLPSLTVSVVNHHHPSSHSLSGLGRTWTTNIDFVISPVQPQLLTPNRYLVKR